MKLRSNLFSEPPCSDAIAWLEKERDAATAWAADCAAGGTKAELVAQADWIRVHIPVLVTIEST